MADQPIKYNSQVEKDEHDDSANIGGKRVILFGWNPNALIYERLQSSNGILQSNATLTGDNVAQETGGNLAAAKTDLDNIATVQGVTTDAAVVGDNNGTISAKLRGLTKILNDVWDSVNHALNVKDSLNLPVTIQTAGITASASGDNTLIAAQGTGKSIYVYAWNISFSGTVNVKFTDGASGTLLNGLLYGVANAGGGNVVKPPYYLFKTSANTALVLNLSGAIPVGGSISYFVI